MWFLPMILSGYVSRCSRRWRRNSLVHVVTDKRGVEEEREPLTGEQEAEGEEGVGDHLGQDKLSQSAEYSAGMEGDNGGV